MKVKQLFCIVARALRQPTCRYCGEPFISAVYPFGSAKQPEGVNMPCRYAWHTDTPTVCQNCAGEHDKAQWWAAVRRADESGDFRDLNSFAVYSAASGSFVEEA